MAEDFNGWRVDFSEDCMQAILHMEPPIERDPYTVEETIAYLKSNGVISGVIHSKVEEMIELRQYYVDSVVAEGQLPKDGVDGYYEFFFNTGIVKNPTIRPDGSVDYSSMSVVHSVRTGDKLMKYHPAIPGKHGFDVKGRELRCKMGKELPDIRSKNIEKLADGRTIVASIDGRVDYSDYKLKINNKYEHKGDLDLVTGQIDFRGDVIVYGNVRSGTVIRATKSITVEGSVEAAILVAEGDIIIKKGMQGAKKGKVISGGNVYANFFEFTEVTAKGNIEANVAMNCKLMAGKQIVISGKRGSIVGGYAYAVGLIETANLGNAAGIKTVAEVGVSEDVDKKLRMLRAKADTTRGKIERAKAEIEVLSDRILGDGSQEDNEEKLMKQKKIVSKNERLLAHINSELQKTEGTFELGSNASVLVHSKAFPGASIKIGGNACEEISSVRERIKFYRRGQSDILTVGI